MTSKVHKSRASNHKKKSWKTIDLTEIDQFLEDQKLDERTGRTDKPIFKIETKGNLKNLEKTKLKNNSLVDDAHNENKSINDICYKHLIPTSQVPAFKSNKSLRLKTPVLEHIKQNNKLNYIKDGLDKRKSRKERLFKNKISFNDIWKQKNSDKNDEFENFEKVRLSRINNYVPKTSVDTTKKPSLLPAIEYPHPGLSYNPNCDDHKELLISIGDKKKKLIKEKKKLNKSLKSGIDYSIDIKEENEKEMLCGLNSDTEDENENENENENTDKVAENNNFILKNLNKKKSKKQIRHEFQTKLAKLKAQKRKEEKLRLTEITKIKKYLKEIKLAKLKTELKKQKKQEKKLKKLYQAANLGKQKYIEPEDEFCLEDELNQSLRKINTDGNLLMDRFKSLQRRNIIEHRRVLLLPKTKVKRKKVIRSSIYNRDLFEKNREK